MPFKREASERVSGSLLLGSELKYSNFPNLSYLFISIVKDQIHAAKLAQDAFGLVAAGDGEELTPSLTNRFR